MADNVTVTNHPLPDYPVATDDVGGQHYQWVKLDLGADGASTPVSGALPVGNESVTLAETTTSVLTSSTLLLAANANRKIGWIQNISNQTIYISHTGTATVSNGMEVRRGQNYALYGSGWVTTQSVHAIHSGSGGKVVLVVEGT